MGKEIERKYLLELCEQPLIEKTRYKIEFGGLIWEVDEFHGVNDLHFLVVGGIE